MPTSQRMKKEVFFSGTCHTVHIWRRPHDLMHITKNVWESLLATSLNMLDKTKDGTNARKDLKWLGVREDL
jgi:hypothetical protein